MTAPVLLSVHTVADWLDLSVSSVWSMAAQGRLPKPIRLANARATRWLASDIEAWLHQQINHDRGA